MERSTPPESGEWAKASQMIEKGPPSQNWKTSLPFDLVIFYVKCYQRRLSEETSHLWTLEPSQWPPGHSVSSSKSYLIIQPANQKGFVAVPRLSMVAGLMGGVLAPGVCLLAQLETQLVANRSAASEMLIEANKSRKGQERRDAQRDVQKTRVSSRQICFEKCTNNVQKYRNMFKKENYSFQLSGNKRN